MTPADRAAPHWDGTGTWVGMDVRHPGCWNIAVTEAVDAGLLGHGLFRTGDGSVTTRLTVFGDTVAAVDAAVAAAREAPDTFAVLEAPRAFGGADAPGNAARELLVDRDPATQISEAFLSRGFVYAEPIVVRDGVERWTVLTGRDRPGVREALDEVRDEEDATIEVTGMRPAGEAVAGGLLPDGRLSARQREVFRLARERGYYARPREATPRELARELGVTTSTFHEHLRKTEAKLLDRPREE